MYTPYTLLKDNVNSTLYAATKPYESMQADVADLRFTRSGVGPKYTLLIVDLFSSYVYSYPMKKKSDLSKKMSTFYSEIDAKREKGSTLWLQTDMEFQQNEIARLNTKYNVTMYSSKMNGGHASAAEQKVRELKKLLYKYSQTPFTKKNTPYKALADVISNMNSTPSSKYGIVPEKINKIAGKSEAMVSLYNFKRLHIIKKAHDREDKYQAEKHERRNTQLRKLKVGDLVLVASGRLKKKDTPTSFDKVTTNKKPPFSKTNIYEVTHRLLNKVIQGTGYYFYYVRENTTKKPLKGRFSRDELFALLSNTVGRSQTREGE